MHARTNLTREKRFLPKKKFLGGVRLKIYEKNIKDSNSSIRGHI